MTFILFKFTEWWKLLDGPRSTNGLSRLLSSRDRLVLAVDTESRTANMNSGLASADVLSSEQNDVFVKYDVLLTVLVSG
jgi:hypothetical protein